MIKHFINGEYAASSSGAVFQKRSPVDGTVAATIAEGGEVEVAAAVAAARQALEGPWSRLTNAQRSELLRAVAAGIERRSAEFIAAEVADTGKPVALASQMDIPRSAANFRVAVEMIANTPNELFESPTPDGSGALNYTVRSPVGVVAVISPWNVPLLMMSSKVAPALACGNTVVVKPSEETPRTAALLGEVMNEAGVPPGVYNVVHGHGPASAGEFLTRHPGVNAIAFTGETRTGAAIMKAAADGARPISLEMGGKCPSIVFADCDFDAAVAGTLRSAFMNCGQICLATERIYVERPIFERFVAAMKQGAEKLKAGPPEDPETGIGPLISREHREKVLSYYRQAVEDGATVVCGGGIAPVPDAIAAGNWIQPTIWTGLPESSRVIREEIFGPCCHIAPFDTEEQAVKLANDTPYGLAASVWTSHLARAHRVAARLAVGVAWVNSWLLRDVRTAFGGAKQSGVGREGGAHSLAFYTETKNICIKL
jgi:aminomuconate-semialdehyde/2-hydroxymuconate-6-semialdehyde dehydrogenase